MSVGAMKKLFLLPPLFACLGCSPAPETQAPAAKPNIILMLTDDQGWQDTSEPFAPEKTPLNERYNTPNLERLAAQGMKFTSAYSNAVCTPTRVALMTGLNQARTRVSNWTHFRDEATDQPHPDLIIPRWNMNGLQLFPAYRTLSTPRPCRNNCAMRAIARSKSARGTLGR